jgi:hypothetical protein
VVWFDGGFCCGPLLRHALKITEQTHGDNIREIAVRAIGVYPRRKNSG